MAAIANDKPDSVILRIKSNSASTETPSDEKTPTPNKNGKISSIAKYRSITENLKKFLTDWNGGRLGGELRLRELVAILRNREESEGKVARFESHHPGNVDAQGDWHKAPHCFLMPEFVHLA